MKEKIEQATYDLLESAHGGWEINEGSDGKIKLVVGTGQFEWEHNENLTSQETTTHTEVLK